MHGCPICMKGGYKQDNLTGKWYRCFCCGGVGIVRYPGETKIIVPVLGRGFFNVRMVSDVLEETGWVEPKSKQNRNMFKDKYEYIVPSGAFVDRREES